MLNFTLDQAENCIKAILDRPRDRRVLVVGAKPMDFPLWTDNILDLSERTPSEVLRAVEDHFKNGTPLIMMASDPKKAVKLPTIIINKFYAFRLRKIA